MTRDHRRLFVDVGSWPDRIASEEKIRDLGLQARVVALLRGLRAISSRGGMCGCIIVAGCCFQLDGWLRKPDHLAKWSTTLLQRSRHVIQVLVAFRRNTHRMYFSVWFWWLLCGILPAH